MEFFILFLLFILSTSHSCDRPTISAKELKIRSSKLFNPWKMTVKNVEHYFCMNKFKFNLWIISNNSLTFTLNKIHKGGFWANQTRPTNDPLLKYHSKKKNDHLYNIYDPRVTFKNSKTTDDLFFFLSILQMNFGKKKKKYIRTIKRLLTAIYTKKKKKIPCSSAPHMAKMCHWLPTFILISISSSIGWRHIGHLFDWNRKALAHSLHMHWKVQQMLSQKIKVVK